MVTAVQSPWSSGTFASTPPVQNHGQTFRGCLCFSALRPVAAESRWVRGLAFRKQQVHAAEVDLSIDAASYVGTELCLGRRRPGADTKMTLPPLRDLYA